MALTTQGTVGTGAGAAVFLAKYWDKLLLDNLYPDLYFYQFADRKVLPANFGKVIFFTKWKKLGAAVGLAENTAAVTTSGFSATMVSAQVSGYAKPVKFTDFLLMTSVSDIVQGATQETAKALALKMDTVTRTTISAAGTLRIAQGQATKGISVCGMRAGDLIAAASVLRNKNAKTFRDGSYGCIANPNQIYDLQSNTVAGNWTDINKYGTGEALNAIYRGEIGKMYGVRVVESSAVPKLVSAAGTSAVIGLSANASGYNAFVRSEERRVGKECRL